MMIHHVVLLCGFSLFTILACNISNVRGHLELEDSEIYNDRRDGPDTAFRPGIAETENGGDEIDGKKWSPRLTHHKKLQGLHFESHESPSKVQDLNNLLDKKLNIDQENDDAHVHKHDTFMEDVSKAIDEGVSENDYDNYYLSQNNDAQEHELDAEIPVDESGNSDEDNSGQVYDDHDDYDAYDDHDDYDAYDDHDDDDEYFYFEKGLVSTDDHHGSRGKDINEDTDILKETPDTSGFITMAEGSERYDDKHNIRFASEDKHSNDAPVDFKETDSVPEKGKLNSVSFDMLSESSMIWETTNYKQKTENINDINLEPHGDVVTEDDSDFDKLLSASSGRDSQDEASDEYPIVKDDAVKDSFPYSEHFSDGTPKEKDIADEIVVDHNLRKHSNDENVNTEADNPDIKSSTNNFSPSIRDSDKGNVIVEDLDIKTSASESKLDDTQATLDRTLLQNEGMQQKIDHDLDKSKMAVLENSSSDNVSTDEDVKTTENASEDASTNIDNSDLNSKLVGDSGVTDAKDDIETDGRHQNVDELEDKDANIYSVNYASESENIKSEAENEKDSIENIRTNEDASENEDVDIYSETDITEPGVEDSVENSKKNEDAGSDEGDDTNINKDGINFESENIYTIADIEESSIEGNEKNKDTGEDKEPYTNGDTFNYELYNMKFGSEDEMENTENRRNTDVTADESANIEKDALNLESDNTVSDDKRAAIQTDIANDDISEDEDVNIENSNKADVTNNDVSKDEGVENDNGNNDRKNEGVSEPEDFSDNSPNVNVKIGDSVLESENESAKEYLKTEVDSVQEETADVTLEKTVLAVMQDVQLDKEVFDLSAESITSADSQNGNKAEKDIVDETNQRSVIFDDASSKYIDGSESLDSVQHDRIVIADDTSHPTNEMGSFADAENKHENLRNKADDVNVETSNVLQSPQQLTVVKDGQPETIIFGTDDVTPVSVIVAGTTISAAGKDLHDFGLSFSEDVQIMPSFVSQESNDAVEATNALPSSISEHSVGSSYSVDASEHYEILDKSDELSVTGSDKVNSQADFSYQQNSKNYLPNDQFRSGYDKHRYAGPHYEHYPPPHINQNHNYQGDQFIPAGTNDRVPSHALGHIPYVQNDQMSSQSSPDYLSHDVHKQPIVDSKETDIAANSYDFHEDADVGTETVSTMQHDSDNDLSKTNKANDMPLVSGRNYVGNPTQEQGEMKSTEEASSPKVISEPEVKDDTHERIIEATEGDDQEHVLGKNVEGNDNKEEQDKVIRNAYSHKRKKYRSSKRKTNSKLGKKLSSSKRGKLHDSFDSDFLYVAPDEKVYGLTGNTLETEVELDVEMSADGVKTAAVDQTYNIRHLNGMDIENQVPEPPILQSENTEDKPESTEETASPELIDWSVLINSSWDELKNTNWTKVASQLWKHLQKSHLQQTATLLERYLGMLPEDYQVILLEYEVVDGVRKLQLSFVIAFICVFLLRLYQLRKPRVSEFMKVKRTDWGTLLRRVGDVEWRENLYLQYKDTYLENKDKITEQAKILTSIEQERDNAIEEKDKLQDENDKLQHKIDKLAAKISESCEGLGQKAEQADILLQELNTSQQHVGDLKGKILSLETTISDLSEQLTNANEQFLEKDKQVALLTENKEQLLQEAQAWNETVQRLTEQVQSQETNLAAKQGQIIKQEEEIKNLNDCLTQLEILSEKRKSREHQIGDDESKADETDVISEQIRNLMDVNRINLILNEVEAEKSSLFMQLNQMTTEKQNMEDKLAEMEYDMQALQEKHTKAEEQSNEAATKLAVLTTYFKEKEAMLQKQLGLHEVKKQEHEEKLTETEKLRNLTEKEINSTRKQMEDLQKEILSIEKSYKAQLTQQEKKAHDNWLAARKAERELAEAKTEAALLRSRLTESEVRRAQSEKEFKTVSSRPEFIIGAGNESQGSVGVSPVTGTETSPVPSADNSIDGRIQKLPGPPMMVPPPLMPRPFLPTGRLPLDRPLPPPFLMPPGRFPSPFMPPPRPMVPLDQMKRSGSPYVPSQGPIISPPPFAGSRSPYARPPHSPHDRRGDSPSYYRSSSPQYDRRSNSPYDRRGHSPPSDRRSSYERGRSPPSDKRDSYERGHSPATDRRGSYDRNDASPHDRWSLRRQSLSPERGRSPYDRYRRSVSPDGRRSPRDYSPDYRRSPSPDGHRYSYRHSPEFRRSPSPDDERRRRYERRAYSPHFRRSRSPSPEYRRESAPRDPVPPQDGTSLPVFHDRPVFPPHVVTRGTMEPRTSTPTETP